MSLHLSVFGVTTQNWLWGSLKPNHVSPLSFRSVRHHWQISSPHFSNFTVCPVLTVWGEKRPSIFFQLKRCRRIFVRFTAAGDDYPEGQRLGEAARSREMRTRGKRRKRRWPGCRITEQFIRFQHKALIVRFRHEQSESSSYLQEQEQQQTSIKNPSARLRSRLKLKFTCQLRLSASGLGFECAEAVVAADLIEARLGTWNRMLAGATSPAAVRLTSCCLLS